MKLISIEDNRGVEYFINPDKIVFCVSHIPYIYEITFQSPEGRLSTIEVGSPTRINGKRQNFRAFLTDMIHNDHEALATKLMEKQYNAVEKMLSIRDEAQYQEGVHRKLMQKEKDEREGAPQHDLSMVRTEVLKDELKRRLERA